jgi:hypothetical protein
VAVKLGPASLSFRGEIEVRGIDPAAKSLHLFAKGTDTTGSSAASMDLTARVEAVDGTTCNLVGTSEVSMSGKAATFGGRVMVPVADQILGQFAANFSAKVQAMHAAPAAASGAPVSPAQATAAAEPKPLNGLALMWAVFKGWLSSLFAAKKS